MSLVCIEVAMDIFKLIGIGIVATVAAVTIKPQKPEIALQISIVAGVLIFIAVADELVSHYNNTMVIDTILCLD